MGVGLNEENDCTQVLQRFLTLWKNADPDIPIYKQAKTGYAKLRLLGLTSPWPSDLNCLPCSSLLFTDIHAPLGSTVRLSTSQFATRGPSLDVEAATQSTKAGTNVKSMAEECA